MADAEEYFDILDEEGGVIGRRARSAVHGNPELRHRAVHVLVFDDGGRIFLQKRKKNKLVQPGRWDSSAGGHVLAGEEPETAAYREMHEELGISGVVIEHLFDFIITNEIETEHVRTYSVVCNDPPAINTDEIEEGRYWTLEEVAESIGTGMLTPSFERELAKLRTRSVSGSE